MVLHNTVNLNKTLHKDRGFVNAIKALSVFLVINFRTFAHFDTVGPQENCTVRDEFQ